MGTSIELVKDAADVLAAGGRLTTDNAIPIWRGQEIPPLPSADTIPTRSVRWLWGGHVPRGKITILAGPAGTGKTTIALDIIARLTRGRGIPFDYLQQPLRGNAIIISTEDDAADTIIPRLIEADANLKKVYIWRDEIPIPQLPDEKGILEAQIDRHDARVLLVDPLSCLLSRALSSNSDADVRRIFAPIKVLADRYDCAVIGVAHLNKQIHGTALSRVGGSVAWAAAARGVLICAPDPEGEQDDFLLAVAKVSNARRPPTLQCRRVASSHDAPVFIEWRCEVDIDADEIVASPKKEMGPQRSNAAEILTEILADGEVKATEIFAHTDHAGISQKTVKRAKKELGIESKLIEGAWYWRFPEAQMELPESHKSE